MRVATVTAAVAILQGGKSLLLLLLDRASPFLGLSGLVVHPSIHPSRAGGGRPSNGPVDALGVGPTQDIVNRDILPIEMQISLVSFTNIT